MNGHDPSQSFLGRIVFLGSVLIAVTLILLALQSVIQAWWSPYQAPVSNRVSTIREQPPPEPAVPAPSVPRPTEAETPQQPGAVSMTNDQRVL